MKGRKFSPSAPPTCAASASGMSQKCTDSGAPSGSARRRFWYIASAGRGVGRGFVLVRGVSSGGSRGSGRGSLERGNRS